LKVIVLHTYRHTYASGGEKWNTRMIENLMKYMCAKNCHNRRSFDKAVAKIKRCSFYCLTWYNLWNDTFECVSCCISQFWAL